MYGYLILRTTGELEVKETKENQAACLDKLYEWLDCDDIENVSILDEKGYYGEGSPTMIIDGCGLYKDKSINVYASSLYQGCGDYIVGDAVLGEFREFPEPDIYPMPIERAMNFKEFFEDFYKKNQKIFKMVKEGSENERE